MLFVLLTLAAHCPATASNQRIALVIGNATYAESPLDNPVRDAVAVSAKLDSLGFTVVQVIDGNLKDMQQGLVEFVSRVEPGATALVFYAGHGVQANGRNYLMPVDASLDSETALRFDAMELTDILEELGRTQARINMVVLDACRNNPFERKFRGGSRGLAVVDAAAGTLIAYATAPGQVASDGDGTNGLYTSALLEALDVPGLKAEEVFKRVRTRVARASNNQQIPWESSSLTGDFVFNQSVGADPGTPLQTAAEPAADREAMLWASIENSDDPAAFDDYLARFPDGTFAGLATRRAERLRTPRGCSSLAGTWTITTSETDGCPDQMTLTRTSDGSYTMRYGVCGAMGLVTNVNGVGSFEAPALTTRWSSFPCSGETVFTFDETCSTGIGRVTERKGLPGVCQVFVSKGVEMKTVRSEAGE
ncbi:MAG: caspase domain-containing protein [Pseudomonadota bacterium]